MTFFALFTLACALSPTFAGLAVARAFQGIGAAFTIPAAQAHIALYFSDPAQKAEALGIWGAAGSLGFVFVDFQQRLRFLPADSLLVLA